MHSEKEDKKESLPKNFDYKNVAVLENYVTPHSRIDSRRRSGLSAKEQRELALAVKRARFLALMPYISR